jgi:hypothetical protein
LPGTENLDPAARIEEIPGMEDYREKCAARSFRVKLPYWSVAQLPPDVMVSQKLRQQSRQ